MPSTPTLQGVLMQVLEAHAGDIHTIDFGRVVSFNRGSSAADIQPLLATRDGEVRAEIQNVPVVFPGVEWDVQAGTYGVLLIGDLSPRQWWGSGEEGTVPDDIRQHATSNAVFLPGLRTHSGSTIPTGDVVLATVTAGGDVLLGEANATNNVVHDGLTSPLNAFLTALNTWGATAWANWAAAAAGFAAVTTTITALQTADYVADHVKVKD